MTGVQQLTDLHPAVVLGVLAVAVVVLTLCLHAGHPVKGDPDDEWFIG